MDCRPRQDRWESERITTRMIKAMHVARQLCQNRVILSYGTVVFILFHSLDTDGIPFYELFRLYCVVASIFITFFF